MQGFVPLLEGKFAFVCLMCLLHGVLVFGEGLQTASIGHQQCTGWWFRMSGIGVGGPKS